MQTNDLKPVNENAIAASNATFSLTAHSTL